MLVETYDKLLILNSLCSRIPRLVIGRHLFGATAFQQVAVVVVVAEWLIPCLYSCGVPWKSSMR